jgi:plasmid stabilization system protein ParE
LEHYAAWYDREAGWEVAQRYLRAVASSIERLAENPEIGRGTLFSAPELRDLRCWPVERHFENI